MRRVPRLLVLVVPVLLAAGCGTPGADLFVATRTGSIPGAHLQMRVIDDGQVVCNGVKHAISSDDLIDAREVVRELADPAKDGMDLPPGRPTILRFRIRTEDGSVAFSDTSKGQPQAFYKAAQLIRTIARGACGLRR